MKKGVVVSIFLAVVVIVVVVANFNVQLGPQTNQKSDMTSIKGYSKTVIGCDVNGDRTVDISDVITIGDIYYGNTKGTGDCDDDGDTDLRDAEVLLEYLFKSQSEKEFVDGFNSPSLSPGVALGPGSSSLPLCTYELLATMPPTYTADGFLRGDANSDMAIDITDGVYNLLSLFVPGSPPIACFMQADANGDGIHDISDATFLLSYLFVLGSSAPPAPFPDFSFDIDVCDGVDSDFDGVDCVTWEASYGSSYGEMGTFALEASDGKYVVGGYVMFSPGMTYDSYLMKIGQEGGLEWEQTYYTSGLIRSGQQTSDGGYILAGDEVLPGGSMQPYLIKTDSEGNVEWEQTYSGTDTREIREVKVTSDGGYALAGREYMSPIYRVLLIKTDSDGNLEWEQSYGSIMSSSEAHSFDTTSDGGYILAGESATGQFYVVRTDSAGNMEWEQYIPGGRVARAVQQTSDGGYIVAGWSYSVAPSTDIYLAKLDQWGDVEWDYTSSGVQKIANSVQQTPDGGYIVAGNTGPVGDIDAYLLKVDSLGLFEWDRSHGSSLYWDNANSVTMTLDGGYLIGGNAMGSPNVSSQIYLIKTDSDGLVI